MIKTLITSTLFKGAGLRLEAQPLGRRDGSPAYGDVLLTVLFRQEFPCTYG